MKDFLHKKLELLYKQMTVPNWCNFYAEKINYLIYVNN